MKLLPILDRELPKRLKSMLAIERPEPINMHLVSQHILDFMLDGANIFHILKRLRTMKNANVVLLLDRKRFKNAPTKIKAEIKNLEDVGVRIHTIRNLHAKIVIVEDNQDRNILITSANLSHQGYYVSHEVGLYCYDCSRDDKEFFNTFSRYITNLIKAQNQ
jgi:phosphatidylserine/phosphatidylglycerophosphate/cardiolipin synthase-like enzyme